MTSVDLLQLPTSTPAAAKLAELRSLLHRHQLDAYLIPSADEHLNEYLPEAKQRRSWISGFTGSAGDLLVGRDRAWLFIDSRYYEQAELEVDAAIVQLCKPGLEDHKTLEEILEDLGRDAAKTGGEFRLGYDPFTTAVHQFQTFQKRVEPCGVVLVSISGNLVDQVRAQSPWLEAEPLPTYAASRLFAVPDDQTGETIAQKLDRVREKMQRSNAHILPITKLDQIAWLFNLRGWDVPYNPVFIAYAIVTSDAAFLFTNLDRIDLAVQETLQSCATLLPYEQYAETLRSLLNDKRRVLLDPKHTTMGTQQLVTGLIVETSSPIEGLKARKNEVEIAQMQQANLKASRAKTRTLKWIADRLASGELITEADVAATVEGFYAEESGFQGLSFNTIAGTGANSSIVHYGTPNPQQPLQFREFLLLDSGAQYASGTTDDTRTIIGGDPSPEQIDRYTEVLKAHINCAMQRFPKGTTGAQLDGITRSTLWFAGLDYGHGTGHGVGAFLNVHEGPNGISKRVQEPLEPGMVTSIEPGYYQPGWGGIRIENLYVVRELPSEPSEDKAPKTPWYQFESLTYIPFDKQLIDWNRLDIRQREWLTQYNQAIIEKLAPTLSSEDADWLRAACQLGD
ncbi:aminopeptidase P family protein [Leptolyngbya sp. FACHB-36]|uniref:aminopeptidase P family protein n=1 Tax=Leptolyngbya sp. FACHB-36 TaxID=2692808 RepID=UPI001680DFF0|nr:aminopeptidase P family protein [Leptolyngbya sp. FACHB-36]MBD2022314.1 aminopeptidase P family protein [Leptolyngbya sp. FACHB-36]